MTLTEAYASILHAGTDMEAHIPRLRELAKGRRVIEFGTRRGISTTAMLAGLPKSLITYDLIRHGDVDGIDAMAKEAGISFLFIQTDIDKLPFIPSCDFVFIDAAHNMEPVKKHLKLANDSGATVIAMHDTVSFGRIGDIPNTRGVLDAVDWFMSSNIAWHIEEQYYDSFGMIVLERSRP